MVNGSFYQLWWKSLRKRKPTWCPNSPAIHSLSRPRFWASTWATKMICSSTKNKRLISTFIQRRIASCASDLCNLSPRLYTWWYFRAATKSSMWVKYLWAKYWIRIEQSWRIDCDKRRIFTGYPRVKRSYKMIWIWSLILMN